MVMPALLLSWKHPFFQVRSLRQHSLSNSLTNPTLEICQIKVANPSPQEPHCKYWCPLCNLCNLKMLNSCLTAFVANQILGDRNHKTCSLTMQSIRNLRDWETHCCFIKFTSLCKTADTVQCLTWRLSSTELSQNSPVLATNLEWNYKGGRSTKVRIDHNLETKQSNCVVATNCKHILHFTKRASAPCWTTCQFQHKF